MLIDNKTQFDKKKTISFYEFLQKNLQKGKFNVVSAYFSAGMLARALDDLNKPESIRMILSDMVSKEKKLAHRIDLLTEDFSIEKVIELSKTAKKAIQFLQQDKVEIKKINQDFCHAKAYIYEHESNENDNFYVVGSSNFTEAGLGVHTKVKNIELNKVATGTSDLYFDKIQAWFDELWQKDAQEDLIVGDTTMINYKQYIISLLEKLNQLYTPEHIYYKILFELYYKDLQEWAKLEQKQLIHFKDTKIYKSLYDFQRKGVLSLIKMLQKYDGAILADAVGLGKTWSALAVMKFFELEGYKVVVLCPKKLSHNWEQYQKNKFSIFEDDEFDYEVLFHTDLVENRLKNIRNTDFIKFFHRKQKILLVIDESHNLRNDKSKRYKTLVDKLLPQNKDVKVLLLSATPINNHLVDVRNQFKLIVKGNDNGFEHIEGLEIKSLQSIFTQAQKEFNEWQQTENRTIGEFVRKLNQKFFDLTDALIVARTRKMIENLVGDTLKFPKHEAPINLYISPKNFGKLTTPESVIDALNFSMWAYRPASFLKDEEIKEEVIYDDRQRQQFLVKMMYILLVKRLESSWTAFKITIENILKHHVRALEKVNAYLANQYQADAIDFSLDGLDEEQWEEIDAFTNDIDGLNLSDLTIGKKSLIHLSRFTKEKLEEFGKAISEDIQKMNDLLLNINDFHAKFTHGKAKDEKLEALIQQIQTKRQKRANPKVLIFTAFKDTAVYLYDQLQKRGFENLAYITGSHSKAQGYEGKNFEPILQRFAPYTKLYKEKDWANLYEKYPAQKPQNYQQWIEFIKEHDQETTQKLENPVHILIATDCLSEGQNLQDCDCVVNYDIHWNPVRLIQRFGRIDRLGSPNESIIGINFWLGEDGFENFLKLKHRIEERMTLMLLVGSEINNKTPQLEKAIQDNPLLDKQEEKMLRQLQTNWEDIEGGNQTLTLSNLSLEEFRQDLLDYLDQHSQVFENMPQGIFSGFQTTDKTHTKGVIALLKSKHESKKYHLVYADQNGNAVYQSDIQILDFLRSYKKAPRSVPPSIEAHDPKTLNQYAQMLKSWIKGQVGKALEQELVAIFAGNYKKQKSKEEKLLEEYYQPENFELIVWEIVS